MKKLDQKPHPGFVWSLFRQNFRSEVQLGKYEQSSRSNRFLLRSHDAVQVLTASCRFFVDVVGTWPGVTGVWLHPFAMTKI